MVEGKTSTRVAMALMCGLAICCAVMYMTADGADVVLATEPAKSVYGIGGPTSVESEDVEKAGAVFTNTPDGRMKLSAYLSNVEAEIAAEEAARKRDVAAVQAQMARNMAFNQQARKKLKKKLLIKMAANAKKAKDDLATAMKFVQKKFAIAASLQNKRNNANIKRSKKLRKTIQKNKIAAKKNLAHQTQVQQEAMAALASATNARIASTNKHVAINAAQIKENAKKAREELDAAVAMFDKKVANARDEAASGRSQLAKQLEEQDKSIRQWANNKLKVVMAKTAAQFRRVREKMAEDRHHADMQLKAAAKRMSASMDAHTLLNDQRFEKTVKDIATAKEEAEARVQAAETEFKVGLNRLTTTVNEQVKKTNKRISQLSAHVEENRVAQAKVNGNVNAEMKRMVKLGNERYEEHLKKDAELKSLIDANKAATDSRMKAMAAHYTEEIGAVRATMKKNRAHASHQLAKKTAELYAEIARSEAAQLKTNGDLQEQTAEAEADIQASLAEAKDDFAERLGNLHETVVDNDKKFEGKMEKLTGVVRANAIKNAKGRKELKELMAANKAELEAAVSDAITKGEARMMGAETKLVNLNKATKAALHMKITTEIAGLKKRANSQIEDLRLSSKEARDMMKKEILMAVRDFATEAKENLDAAKDMAIAKFAAVNEAEANAAKAAAEDRAKIGEQIKIEKENVEQQLSAAVSTMHRGLLALQHETRESIKKTNTRVDAYAAAVKKEATDVAELMDSQMTVLTGAIESQKAKATESITAADAASAARFAEAADAVTAGMKAAEEESNKKFNKLYTEMAEQREELDNKLGAAVKAVNEKIATQAALADSRFESTVKDIQAAREEAAADVAQARKDFSSGLLTLTTKITSMESKLLDDVATVAGALEEHQVKQRKVNAAVQAEIKRIDELMDLQKSESVRARGKLRGIMDENKRAAHEEVESLRTFFNEKITKILETSKENTEAAGNDLEEATDKMFTAMAEVQTDQIYQNQVSATKIGTYKDEALAGIDASKKDFSHRLNELADTIAANHKHDKERFQQLTDVVDDYKEAGEADRALIRDQHEALNDMMKTKIRDAIDKGEARAHQVATEARENLAGMKSALLVEITDTVEAWADATFKTIQGDYAKIADNYLSLKAYAITAEAEVVRYVGQGKGKNLSSLGDLLVNIAALSAVKAAPAEGIAPEGKITSLYDNEEIKLDDSVSKVNGLVREFVLVANGVRERWPMGLGKYLLLKLEASMAEKGVLQVDKVADKSGNWVYINGHAVGLSNKLNDFEELAVRMAHYEASLAKLTGHLAGQKNGKNGVYAKPPEWQGN